MIVKLLTEHHLEFLSLKGGCRGSSESPGRVAQSVTCLVTDAKLTADPGVASSIPARSHARLLVNCLFKLAQEKSVVR